MKGLNVLIIDDHPLIVNAYTQALENVGSNMALVIDCLGSIDEFKEFLKSNSTINNIDLIFLDIRLPVGSSKDFLSGEDIGIYIRNLNRDTKIIISTSLTDNFRVQGILKSIDPEGFLIKNDLTPKELILAIENVISGSPYYSNLVLTLLRKQFNNDKYLDELDRRLLYELSLGTKMKDLPKILPLSIAGIEKRKRNLKILFNVENDGDRGLILVAKEKGFL
ncbi:response regulator [Christiangramia sp. LLG6405-1]|uniref:response regulator n=1 Tax=Christiangramia sp. LLG6405-1 TaxID=3160832 RepID=UPI0038690BA2